MNVYIVVVTYNPKKWLKKCFESIKESTVQLNVIIVDNGSTDGSQAIIKKEYPEFHFIQSKENLGFGKANNIGIKKAYQEGADFIFLQNQDAYIEPTMMEKLVNVSLKHPDFGIISPVHLSGEKTFDMSFAPSLNRSPKTEWLNDILLPNKKEISLKEIYEIYSINAALWLLPRHTIEKVGGFNPYFFHYGEDAEYTERVKFHHLKIGFVPSAFGIHDRVQKNSDFKAMQMSKTNDEIRLLNPENSLNINKFISKKAKDAIFSLILLNFKEFNNNYNTYLYFSSRKNEIENSLNLIKNKPKLLFLENGNTSKYDTKIKK